MNLKGILKKTGIVLLIAFVVIQFLRPQKNISGNIENDISKAYPVSEEVKAILNTACNDCHSNLTDYPWYSNIQPVAWWLADHVNEGKRKLNFNEFLTYRTYRQYHKMEEVAEVLADDEMPLQSYTIVHRDAKLSQEQKEILMHWSKSILDSMESRYPKDSLVKPNK